MKFRVSRSGLCCTVNRPGAKKEGRMIRSRPGPYCLSEFEADRIADD